MIYLFLIPTDSESFNQAGELITQEILTEEIVARESLNLPNVPKVPLHEQTM